MGYSTSFDFSIQEYGDVDATNDKIALHILHMYKNGEQLWPIAGDRGENLLDFLADESQDGMEISTSDVRWYEYGAEMLALSKQFPKTVFKLHGEGETNGDIWDAYYKNGMTCLYKLPTELPPFNPKDLCSPNVKPTAFFK